MDNPHVRRLLAACETKWERRFVNAVLIRVPDLPWEHVTAQKPFRDDTSRERRFDFAIGDLDTGIALAIEVDGYDKTGRGSGMTRGEFTDWMRRQTAAASQGWTVLRFANTDVRDHPQRCARTIELALQQAIAEHEAVTSQSTELTRTQQRLREALAELDRLRRASSAEPSSGLKARLDDAEAVVARRRQEVAREALGEPAAAELAKELTDQRATVERLVKELDASKQAADAASHRSRRGWVVAVAAGTLTLLLAAVLLAAGSNEDPLTAGRGGSCSDPLTWRAARDVAGDHRAIAGPVRAISQATQATGRPTFVNVGGQFPSQARFDVVMFEEVRDQLDFVPEVRLAGATICVFGLVEMRDGVPQTVVTDPDAIQILP